MKTPQRQTEPRKAARADVGGEGLEGLGDGLAQVGVALGEGRRL